MNAAESDLLQIAAKLASAWRALSVRQARRVPDAVRAGIDELGRALGPPPARANEARSERFVEHTRANSVVARLTRIDNPLVRFRGPLELRSFRPGERLSIGGPAGCVTTPVRSLSPLAKGRFFVETQNSAYLLSFEEERGRIHAPSW